jgi:hypothetical protein
MNSPLTLGENRMNREYLTKPAKLLKHSRNWLRIDCGDESYLASLCQSYLARPLYPIICTPDFEIEDGNLRLEAVLRHAPTGGDTELPLCITNEAVTPALLLEIQMDSAAHTKALSDYEQFIGGSEWLKLTGATAKELAGRIHRDEPTLSKILSLAKCVEPVRDAAAAGKIGYSKWWALSKLPPAEQPALLAQHLNGATRDELERHRRKQRTTLPPVKMSRIKIPLATEISTGIVTIAGDGIDLEAGEDMLKEALKSIRNAKDKGLDTKTAQAVWRDMARA